MLTFAKGRDHVALVDLEAGAKPPSRGGLVIDPLDPDAQDWISVVVNWPALVAAKGASFAFGKAVVRFVHVGLGWHPL